MNFALPTVYITLRKSAVKEDSWHFISKDSFKGIMEYLRYGIPSMIMVCLEYWAFEFIMIMSGLVGEYELAACSILFNMGSLINSIAIGFGLASNTFIGNNLGANIPETAKMYLNISFLFSLIFPFIIGIPMYIFRYKVGYIFTDDENVVSLVGYAFPVMILLNFGDYIQGILQGAIKGMGYQSKVAYICLI
mmetsp:Transcript_11128/g.11071  ORF Transcript_11128/g.11071 Transcript_11128/m.11071 type:complete len:192 (-) Transcript_11128:145-720(-)